MQERHRARRIMRCVASVLLSILTLLVRILLDGDINLNVPIGIRLLDGRITTLLEARALTLFAANTSIKSASWG